MATGFDISIIIVNYNTRELIKQCLESIYCHTEKMIFEIIVVDNASSDGSVEMIVNEFPEVILIRSKTNIGFGRANNLGIDVASGQYFFLLNSDTIFLNNALLYFLEYIISHRADKIGCLGSFLLDSELKHNRSESRFPTNISTIIDLKKSLISKFGIAPVNKEIKVQTRDTDCVVGADLFIPKHVIEKIGYFDPIYFMYYEETDLQLRMKKQGYSRKIIEGPRIIHLEGKSNNIKYERLIMFKKSSFLYFKKNSSSINYIFHRILSLVESLGILLNVRSSFSIYEKIKFLKFNLSSLR